MALHTLMRHPHLLKIIEEIVMSFFHIDSLLREALVISGCTDTQIGSFDGYSTIELRLDQPPTLNIDSLDNDFWFWSELPEISDVRMAYHCEALLRFLMHRCCFARTEQMQLVKVNNQLELRVLLAECWYPIRPASALTCPVDESLSTIEVKFFRSS